MRWSLLKHNFWIDTGVKSFPTSSYSSEFSKQLFERGLTANGLMAPAAIPLSLIKINNPKRANEKEMKQKNIFNYFLTKSNLKIHKFNEKMETGVIKRGGQTLLLFHVGQTILNYSE